MSDEEIIEVVSALKANDKTMKDSGISDNLWGKAVECIMFLQSENAQLTTKSEVLLRDIENLTWREKASMEFERLESENAELHARLENAVELPVPLGTPILKVWKNRVPEDDARMSFVGVWEITTVNFKLEHYPLWGKYYFPKGEEGRKAAEARLADLKGGKER